MDDDEDDAEVEADEGRVSEILAPKGTLCPPRGVFKGVNTAGVAAAAAGVRSHVEETILIFAQGADTYILA